MYADDTILYSCAPTLGAAISNLQSDFIVLQHVLIDFKLLLNGSKTKAMLFVPNKTALSKPPRCIITLDGTNIEYVDMYKYLGIWLDMNFNFKQHIDLLSKKLKFTVGFLYRLKSCFSLPSRKWLVASLFLSQLDYGDTVLARLSWQNLTRCIMLR